MLHHRHQLDVREVHLLHVISERLGDFAIAHRTIIDTPPRSEMHFIDRLGSGECVALAPRRHPIVVAPLVVEVPHDRCRLRRSFVMHPEWIRFIDAIVIEARDDVVLVDRPFREIGNETFPQSRLAAQLELVALGIPIVEVADDAHVNRIRRPDAKRDAARHDVRAEFLPQLEMRPFVEEMKVPIGEKRLSVIDQRRDLIDAMLANCLRLDRKVVSSGGRAPLPVARRNGRRDRRGRLSFTGQLDLDDSLRHHIRADVLGLLGDFLRARRSFARRARCRFSAACRHR